MYETGLRDEFKLVYSATSLERSASTGAAASFRQIGGNRAKHGSSSYNRGGVRSGEFRRSDIPVLHLPQVRLERWPSG